MSKTRVQYILVEKKTGRPAMWCHQDDMEDPLVDDTIEGLLHSAADWADMSVTSFVKFELPNYVVKREEVVEDDLTEREREVLEQLKVALGDDDDDGGDDGWED